MKKFEQWVLDEIGNCKRKEGVYLKASNKGNFDFELAQINTELNVYMKVVRAISDWRKRMEDEIII